MEKIVKNAATAIIILLVTVVDIPLLPIQLVPEAEAVFGVRRRTAVIAYSAGAATATAASNSAAASQQQVPLPPQQASPAQPVSAVPVGTIVGVLPGECVPITAGNTSYQECGGSLYRAAFQGNNLVYVVVEKPL